MSAHWSLAFDIGSTYVDTLLLAPDGRELGLKHPRRDQSPAQAALSAVRRLLAEADLPPSRVGRVVHGSTIVTNALVEQSVAPAAWLTTRGFGDVLRLGRQQREALYAAVPRPRVPVALFPQSLCFEVGGRIDAQGREVQPLDDETLAHAIDGIAAVGVRAVGVGLLFSHLNPAHELAVAQQLQQRLPWVAVSLSHRVDGQAGEYERFLATALDACLRPVAADYLSELAAGLAHLGLPVALMMGSDATTLPLTQAGEQPLRLALSGPAGALLEVAGRADAATLICMDVGGTTTDIGIVQASRPLFADTLAIGPYAWRQRAVDIASLPVGGGSLVRLLSGAALRVGPHSAGADPGPVAFGRGGTVPTLTDALLLLERLPTRLAGGLELRRDAAAAALAPLAAALDTTPTGVAQAVVDAAAATIAEGLKRHAFERGIDPAEAVLLAAGGGGAQHAAEVASLLGMRRVRVPTGAGLLAARGLLLATDASASTSLAPAPSSPEVPRPERLPQALPNAAPASADWSGVPCAGVGPAALFGPSQSAWVPRGWAWHVEPGGDLCLQACAND